MKRWWGIRHLRYWWHRRELLRWWEQYVRFGGPGIFINQADWDWLDRVWRGET